MIKLKNGGMVSGHILAGSNNGNTINIEKTAN